MNAVCRKGKVKQSEVVSGIEGLYFDDCDGIIGVGTQVCNALNKLRLEYHALPHPSSRNRKLNCQEYEKLEIKKLGEFITELKLTVDFLRKN